MGYVTLCEIFCLVPSQQASPPVSHVRKQHHYALSVVMKQPQLGTITPSLVPKYFFPRWRLHDIILLACRYFAKIKHGEPFPAKVCPPVRVVAAGCCCRRREEFLIKALCLDSRLPAAQLRLE